MNATSSRQAIPPDVVALCDYERHAQQHLSDAAWAFLQGGAADELTLQANRQAWDTLLLHPRVLRPLAGGHTRTELLGRPLAWPLLQSACLLLNEMASFESAGVSQR